MAPTTPLCVPIDVRVRNPPALRRSPWGTSQTSGTTLTFVDTGAGDYNEAVTVTQVQVEAYSQAVFCLPGS